MLHLGDITKINGANIAPVDVATAGTPCQDLSVAGKREGLAGERSGLFMEFVRIVKEMLEATNGEYPKYAVWENVPGAFSSNKGEDFRCVLEELCRLKDPGVVIPQPPKGKWKNAGCIVGDGWSLAWRVLDAQFWGVPQRRRRISLVLDLGGESAGEISFVEQSLRGHSAPGREAGQRVAADAERGAGGAVYPINTQVITWHNSLGRGTGFGLGEANDPAYTLQAGHEHGVFAPVFCPQGTAPDAERGAACAVRMREGCAGGGKGPLIQWEKSGTLATGNDQTIFCLQGNAVDRDAKMNGLGVGEDVSFTLNTVDRHAVAFHLTQDPISSEDCTPCLSAGSTNGQATVGVVAFTQKRFGEYEEGVGTLVSSGGARKAGKILAVWPETARTLAARHDSSHCVDRGQNVICMATGQANAEITENFSPTLNCAHEQPIASTQYSVRRLTPLEAERLQGFPDGWTDIPDYTDTNGKSKKVSDSARYKALGNSIALPPWRFILGQISKHLPPDATLGSLFDGIGGFPLIWEELHGRGSALWASEIDEFPIAVTKYHFSMTQSQLDDWLDELLG